MKIQTWHRQHNSYLVNWTNFTICTLCITKISRLSTENPTLTTTGRAVYLHCCVRSPLLSSLYVWRLSQGPASLRWRDLQIGNTDVFLYFFCDFLKRKKTILGSTIPTNWIKAVGISPKREIFVMWMFLIKMPRDELFYLLHSNFVSLKLALCTFVARSDSLWKLSFVTGNSYKRKYTKDFYTP